MTRKVSSSEQGPRRGVDKTTTETRKNEGMDDCGSGLAGREKYSTYKKHIFNMSDK